MARPRMLSEIGDEVVEVAADDLGRNGLPPDVEAVVLRHALRKDRCLDALRLDDERLDSGRRAAAG